MSHISFQKFKDVWFLSGVVIFIFTAVIFGLFSMGILPTQNMSHSVDMHSPDFYAQKMVKICQDVTYKPTCYEDEIPRLVTDLEMSEIFDVIRLVRKYDPSYAFCHVTAHDLGSYEVSLDPDNWLNAISKGPTDGLCSNGFAHGAIVSRFNDGKLSPEAFEFVQKDLSIACEPRQGWNPTELIKAICYHGIGHVLVHMTEADIPVSLNACESIALKDDGRDYRQVCYEGVYMQLFQPLEPEDFALIDRLELAPTKDNIAEFCSQNSSNDMEYGTCWRESWPLFYDQLFTRDGVLNYCGALKNESDRNKCFVTAFTINGRQNLGQPEKMAGLCNSMPPEQQGLCLSRGANAFPEEDPTLIPEAINMCSRGSSKSVQDECYSYLAQLASFNFHAESDSFELMCNSLPAEWEDKCRQ